MTVTVDDVAAHPLGTLSGELVAEVAASCLGRPVEVTAWQVEPVPYPFGSPATGGLFRVRARTADGADFTVFVKQLQHPRHWVLLGQVPDALREDFLLRFPWQAELVAWDPGFLAVLPPGLRVPRLHRLVDQGDDRLAIWMEDVRVTDAPWDDERYVRAARLLGALAANRSAPEQHAAAGVPIGHGLRMYVEGRVKSLLPALEQDELWDHPLMASSCDADLRPDLIALGRRLPGVLDRLDALPQALPHGDASPQNLLQPAAEPETLVAIDVSFQSSQAVGFDLDQLLVGLVHAGELPSAALPDLQALLVPAFTAGARAAGLDVTENQVLLAHAGSLLARAGFTSLPLERLGEPVTHELQALFTERAALTRFIVDCALRVL